MKYVSSFLGLLAVVAPIAIAQPSYAGNQEHFQRALTQRYCTDCDLSGFDFSAIYLGRRFLRGAYFIRSNFVGAKMEQVFLRGAVLNRSDLSETKLYAAKLSNADLRNTKLIAADLNTADLQGALLDNADLTDADLRFANLEGASLENAEVGGATFCRTIMPDGSVNNLNCALIGIPEDNPFRLGMPSDRPEEADIEPGELEEPDSTELDVPPAEAEI